MVKSFGIEIKGIPKAKRYVNGKLKLAIDKASEGIKDAGLHLQGEVKQSIAGQRNEPTSVDTGRFLSSVDVSIKKLQANVFSNIPYAKYLEFGTSRIRARKHFQNTQMREKLKVVNIVRTKVNQI